jgi:hypothetical protein
MLFIEKKVPFKWIFNKARLVNCVRQTLECAVCIALTNKTETDKQEDIETDRQRDRTESNPSVARYGENTEKKRSVLPTSILRLFLGPLVVWPKVGELTELLRISKEWRGLRFSSYLASTYLRVYKAT